MGCCFSHSAGPNSPYPGGVPSGSARAINPQPVPAPPIPGSAAAGGGGGGDDDDDVPDASNPPAGGGQQGCGGRRRRREQRPLDQHIDKPLRRHEWTSRDRLWTPRALARERADFFDTRVTGRPEIWQTLRSALEILWDPLASGSAADDGSDGLATAQIILTAAEITLPTGDLAQGAYDSLGNYYALPEWVVADPSNLVVAAADEDDDDDDDDDGTGAGGDAKGDITAGEETGEEELDDDEVLRRREEKGKAVVDIKNLVAVHARLSENSQDVTVSVGKGDSVRSVAHKIQEDAGLPSSKKVRLAYMGKILKENASLVDQGWKQGHVVNALVFNR